MDPQLQEIFESHACSSESLIAILQDIQEKFHYLAEDNLKLVSEQLAVPLHQVYSVTTFYNAFSLKPKGKYVIQVCMGTACHVRGADRLLEELERELGIANGETTPDQQFSLETVNCLGACALGPIMVVDGTYHGHMAPHKVNSILQKYRTLS